MSKRTVLALGLLLVSGGSLFADKPRDLSGSFSLAGYATSSGFESLKFRLAEPNAGALGAFEDPNNTAFGIGALGGGVYLTGTYNSAFGVQALLSNTWGSGNTAVGHQSLYFSERGPNNTAVGIHALYGATMADENTAIGAYALESNGTLSETAIQACTAIGFEAMLSNTMHLNTAVGWKALHARPGGENVAVGAQALYADNGGERNTAIGNWALNDNTTGNRNVALGYWAGAGCTTGYWNIFIGTPASTSDEKNTIRIGEPALFIERTNSYAGQNVTYIAGIVETALNESMTPAVVGITPEGRLGTMSNNLLPEGPQGPQGIPGPAGPAGPGLVSGSLLFLIAGAAPPVGYTYLGNFDLALRMPESNKPSKITISVYRMN